MDSIAPDVLYNRLRNRIIEHLELAASAEEQLNYQRAAPIAHVSNELLNTWGDWVKDESTIDQFTAPIFTLEEQQAVRDFNSTVDSVARQTAHSLPYITNFIGTPAWQELSSSAASALSVFSIRGLGPED